MLKELGDMVALRLAAFLVIRLRFDWFGFWLVLFDQLLADLVDDG